MSNNIKKRDWAFIMYPESMPSNWEQIITDIGLPIAISPLHDKDLVSETDEAQKKAHYHGIIRFDGPTTFNNVKTVLAPLNGPIPKPINSIKSAYRYFTHDDNPEKYQYSKSEIRHFNGFNEADIIELSASEKRALRVSIQRLIIDNDFVEYADLMDFLLDNDLMDMHDLASSSTMFFDGYIRSRRNKKKENLKDKEQAIVDKEYLLDSQLRKERERTLETTDPSAMLDALTG